MFAYVLHPARASLLLALLSAAILLAALALQFLGGLAPCPLCIWQRWPYVALVALGLIGWRWRSRALLGIATLVLLGAAGLAAYHVGIEQGWWALPGGCIAGVTRQERRGAEAAAGRGPAGVRSGRIYLPRPDARAAGPGGLPHPCGLRHGSALDVARRGAQTGSRRPNVDHKREESRGTLRLVHRSAVAG